MKLFKSLITGFLCFLLILLKFAANGQACFTTYSLTPTPGTTNCGPTIVTMSGSQYSSVSYQLTINGVNYGSPVNGTGSSISFGPVDINHGGTCLVYASQTGSSCPPTVVANTTLVFYTVPSGTVTSSSYSVCSASPGILSANVTGFYNYQWYLNGSAISGATSSTYSASVGGTYSVLVSNACYSATLTCSPITTLPSLGAISNILPGNQQYTAGAVPTSFTAVVSGANTNGYSWTLSQPNAGTVISGTTSTAQIAWNTSFVGEVTITATATGCGSPTTKSLTINILPVNSTTYTTQAEGFINYVKESDVRTSGVTTSAAVENIPVGQKNVTFTYYNGLGIAAQKVTQMASPNNNVDIVQQIDNDQYGREAIKYQPYAATTQNGSYHPYAIAEQQAFYNPSTPGAPNITTTPFPYAETSFEPSPLNRVMEQGAPGDVWQLTGKPAAVSPGHTVKVDFTTNDLSTFNTGDQLGTKKVLLYIATINSDQSRTLTLSPATNYNPGTLYVSITKDENWIAANGVWGTTEEYKDIEGHVVLKRIYNKNGTATDMYSTYYVYDDFGNLAFVLPPAANPDGGITSANNQAILDNLCYQYRYDQKNRLVQKKLPGKGWDFMIYNPIDHIVMTQDANQRNKTPQQFTYTKYDALSRPVVSGLWNWGGSNADGTNLSAPGTAGLTWLQGVYNTESPVAESRSNSTATGYTNSTIPGDATSTYYAISFYDDYTATPFIPAGYLVTSGTKRTRGLLTATFTNVLTTSDMLSSVTYYDDYGRVANQYNQHYLGGTLNAANYDLISNNYNFDNSMNTVQRTHYNTAGGTTAAVNVLNKYIYDLVGRQKQLIKNINSTTGMVLSQFDYNEIGQLVTKHLNGFNGGAGQATAANITLGTSNAITSGNLDVVATNSIVLGPNFSVTQGATFSAKIGGFLQNITYTYNERGWLTSINNPVSVNNFSIFGMQLYYGSNPNAAQLTYNGNIGTVKWQTLAPAGSGITQQQQTFDYSYDNINRLTLAHYTSPVSTDAGAYDEAPGYDKNGNILTLNRWGKPSGVQQIDQLQYTYANGNLSNQLTSVNDAITAYPTGQPAGLASYTYDNNGNQITDSKKATNITYNFLNLPQNITVTGSSSQLGFVYAADGRKLRKIFSTSSATTTRDYIDGIEYNNGTIEFVQTEEGRATPGSSYVYEYFLKDHLGNTRATIKQDGTIYQVQDYYAFGMDIPLSAATTPDNRYKYNGKEFETEVSLNKYDYGARFYDPVIGHFTTIDAQAEDFEHLSPYNYAENNPILMIDPDGNAADSTITPKPPTPTPTPAPATTIGIVLDDVIVSASPIVKVIPFIGWGFAGWQAGSQLAKHIQRFSFGLTGILRKLGVSQNTLVDPRMRPDYVMSKHEKGDKLPTPETDPDKFTKQRGDQGWKRNDTGEVYKKSHTSHGNQGNTGTQWKVWPEGTSDFGSNSKKSGDRTTLDQNGVVIGN